MTIIDEFCIFNLDGDTTICCKIESQGRQILFSCTEKRAFSLTEKVHVSASIDEKSATVDLN